MRDYGKMTEEEFIEAYETPYSEEERTEKDKIIMQQINSGMIYEMTDEAIDELFEEDEKGN